jgi:flagellar motor switch protein FliN/FliY
MKNQESSEQIIHHLETALSHALSSMTGKDFSVTTDRSGESVAAENAIIWEQSFSLADGPALWLVAGQDLWTSAGRLTLGAAGIDEVTDDDCRSTWLEIIGQTMGGFATGLTADLQSEVTVARGDEAVAEPADMRWTVCSVQHDNDGKDEVAYFRIAWSNELAAVYDPPETAQKSAASRDNSVSKTFDLLLDVALPVSVSFGKTSLQIREVLKLNTGSIVELNRFVAEPVEVIVNDCVIARGEVVVVDGNYGVRITQLASREDRLRSGISESASRIGVAPR